MRSYQRSPWIEQRGARRRFLPTFPARLNGACSWTESCLVAPPALIVQDLNGMMRYGRRTRSYLVR